MHVAKLDHPVSSRQLKQQSWTQQHEQHHCYHNRPPIRHINFSFTNSAPTHCNSCTSYSLKRSIGKKDKRVCVSFYTRKESNLMAVSVNNKKSCSSTILHRNRYSFSFDTCQRQCGNVAVSSFGFC